MNVAIVCTCGTVIVYDSVSAGLTCPNCRRRWMPLQPELFSDNGVVAKRLPNLLADRPDGLDDESCHAIIKQVRQLMIESEEYSRRFSYSTKRAIAVAFVFEDGTSKVVPLIADAVSVG